MFKVFGRTIFLFVLFGTFLPNTLFAASFGVRPAYPRPDNPRTESIFFQNINPGNSVEEGVKVINSTNEPKNLILYSRDSLRSSGGGFACTQISEEPTKVGTWIKFNIENLEEDVEAIRNGKIPGTIDLTIPAGTEVIIPFTISVPQNASIGEHNGCILIQEAKNGSGQTGVSLSLRSGLRVAINVPGKVERRVEFADFKIEKINKSIYLRPSVKNTGNVSVDTLVNVNVRYFFGLSYEKFGGEFPVLRDEVYDFNFELKKPMLGGFYMATAVFEYDQDEKASIGVKSGEKFTKSKSETIWFFSTPTIFGLIIEISFLIILLFIFAIWRLNKKKKKWIKKWIDYTIEEGDTVERISRENKIHWEIFTEVNKIKPPYVLKQGDVVKIPPPRRKKKQN